MRLRRRRRDLWVALATRTVGLQGELVDLLSDATLRQDMRWVTDQMAGRRSVA